MKYLLLILLIVTALPSLAETYIDFSTGQASGILAHHTNDGRFTVSPAVGVNTARTTGTPESRMIYLDVTDPFPPMEKAFVIVEYYDMTGDISLQYDGSGNAYFESPDRYAQTDSGEWMTCVFLLQFPVWNNRENGGHDFRILCQKDLAVRRVEVTSEKPAFYALPRDPMAELEAREPNVLRDGMTAIQQWQIHEPLPGEDLSDTAFLRAKKLGITSMQSYVGLRQLEPEEGRLDFSWYDGLVGQLKKHGMKWLPFLIMAPEKSVPDWWTGQNGVFAKCLEHGEEAPVQSVWNPALRDGVKHFLTIFREHYGSEVIEALNFGISGCWGESIHVAGGGFGIMDRHQHSGYWCGDRYAAESFRSYMKDKYGSIDALNKAWKTSYGSFDAAEPFIPDDTTSKRAAKDLNDWYFASMTDLAEFWVKTARELYPDTPIYICTGGNGNVKLGADFSDQARRIAPYNAGIRITNENDDVANNFSVTRMVSSACRLYGAYYTTEPGGDNTPDGIPGRVFDATAGGAIGAYFKYLMDKPDLPNIRGIRFAENSGFFRKNVPDLKVAALMPNTSIGLKPELIDRFISLSSALRKAQDFEWLDENMIEDGLQNRFRAIVLLAGQVYEQATLDRLEEWVKAGGVLLSSNETLPLATPEDAECSWIRPAESDWSGALAMAGEAKEGYAVDVGNRKESGLTGVWHAGEGNVLDPSDSGRWTAGESSVVIPLPAGDGPVLKILAKNDPEHGVDCQVLADGVPIGSIKKSKASAWNRFELPAGKYAGRVKVTFRSGTFTGGPNDPRKLGVYVQEIMLSSKASEKDDIKDMEDTSLVRYTVDESRLASSFAPLGKGWIGVFPENSEEYLSLVSAALYWEQAPWSKALAESGLPHGGCLAGCRTDGEFDEVISSVINTEEGQRVLYYNDSPQYLHKRLPNGRTIAVPEYSFAELTVDEACAPAVFEASPIKPADPQAVNPGYMLSYTRGSLKDYALVREPVEEGSGWVIVLHGHGSGADQLYTRPDITQNWLPELADKYGIVTFDTMGNGWMNPTVCSNIHDMLEWLKAKYGIDRFTIIGGSMGGSGALAYAICYPDDINGVLALCPCTDLKSYTEFLSRTVPEDPLAGIKKDIRDTILQRFDANEMKMRAVSPQYYSWRLPLPVFISHAAGDELIPVENSRKLAELMEGLDEFEYLEMEGGNHDTTVLPGFARGLEFLREQGALQ
ncbi:MAG: alpha/beta fold hydrolase [Abditibacteriota bacterium]|nr:alpha/beta fold hydrolase [Abditibacteriota bacterium]